MKTVVATVVMLLVLQAALACAWYAGSREGWAQSQIDCGRKPTSAVLTVVAVATGEAATAFHRAPARP